MTFCLFQEYIHRVGRTARGEGSSGHALLILRPEELGFLRYLKQAKVPLNEFEFSWSKIADIQLQVSLAFILAYCFLASVILLYFIENRITFDDLFFPILSSKKLGSFQIFSKGFGYQPVFRLR